MADYRGKSVLIRAKTKLEKERWEWLARRRKISVAELIRETLGEAWRLERSAHEYALSVAPEQRKVVA